MSDDNKHFVGGMLVGSAIGVVLGILIAPDSGEKTRQKLKNKICLFKDYLVDEVINGSKKRKSRPINGKIKAKIKKAK